VAFLTISSICPPTAAYLLHMYYKQRSGFSTWAPSSFVVKPVLYYLDVTKTLFTFGLLQG